MPRPFDLMSLAATGVCIDLSNETHKPFDLSSLMLTVVKNNGHLIVSGKGFTPFDFQALAATGKNHLTIKW